MTVASPSDVSSLLSRLGLAEENSGAFAGSWLATTGPRVESINPATGKAIAAVRDATSADYEKVAASSAAAFHAWKRWPAPRRGEVVRQLGEALRQHKDDLGQLVTLEIGKIRSEGLGEVQEMIDMADFCRRPLAPALRPDDAQRAAAPPHVRAVASAGTGRASSRPSTFPSPSGPGTP